MHNKTNNVAKIGRNGKVVVGPILPSTSILPSGNGGSVMLGAVFDSNTQRQCAKIVRKQRLSETTSNNTTIEFT